MRKLKMTALAIALNSSFVPLAFAEPESPTDFHGYARGGVSTTSNGGEQMCFGSGANAHYTGRLGDECESYYELGLGHNYEAADGKSFYFDSMFSAETSQGAQYNDYQSLSSPDSEDGRGDWALRQLNVQATGLLSFAPEATLWVGKRYYQRHEVSMMDLFYLNNSGHGAGIENIKAGVGKLSLAMVNGHRKTFNGKANAEDVQSVQTQKFDVRYSDIPLGDQAKLELVLIYGRTDVTDIQKAAGEKEEDGLFFTAEMNHQLFGAKNTMVVQYASDVMADAAWSNTSGFTVDADLTWRGDNDSAYRFIDYGTVRLSDKIDLGYSLLYTQAETLASAGDVVEEKPTRSSVVMRPSYYWSENTRTTIEIGVTNYKESDDDKNRELQKFVIAQEFTPDVGLNSRPSIRFYAGSFFGNVAEDYVYGSEDGEDGNLRIGAQFEAWW